MIIFAEFYERWIIHKGVNGIFLVLLPKKNKAKELSDFRPINLIGSLYKIIAKVLSMRLREVMEKVVLNTQSVFLQGKQILDSVLIANECVEEKRRSKRA